MPGANDLAFIQCTSGSVSAPKAVMVTHANIMANSAIISHTFDTTPNSVSVCWLPSYHDMGLIDGVLQPIYAGFHAVHLSPMHFLSKPAHWLLAMSKYKATYSGGPNFAFDYCAQRIADSELELLDFSNLQCIYNGAEPISLQTLQRFLQRFSKAGFQPQQLLTCYGLAEGTLAVTTAALGHAPMACHRPTMETRPFDQWPLHMPIDDMVVSSGSPRVDTKVWILDEEGQPCSEGQTGEIVIAGASITAGYWQAAETTQQAYFLYHGFPCFRTGDLGFMWQQQLYINGRLKDLIILRGKNHYPQDIENVAANAYPDLENNGCAAFSIQQNGEEQLVIVQEIKRTSLATFAADDAAKKIQLALSQHFGIVAASIIFVRPRTIPKTTSGKVQRNKCKSLLLSKQIIPFQNDKNQRGDH
jgi:acyl-CoA synthetase (AMP-forming)/AMP-acid ligase II